VGKLARNALLPMTSGARSALSSDVSESSQFLARELLADNDELRETNRQLIAAMEEIQSLNVTLQSVNEALHSTNLELRAGLEQARVRSLDLEHMLNGVGVAAVLLNEALEVRDYNATSSRYFTLTRQDIGRSISRVRHGLVGTSVSDLCREALDHGEPLERIATSASGILLSLRIREVDVGGQQTSVMISISEITDLGLDRAQLAV
jgi:nitrogen fixation/metabolism regulation signal transduction histidine kinase